jgi:glycosyltransferase involved in cell wall biosynthesis
MGHRGATVPCGPVTRVLAVCAVNRPGGAEIVLLRLLRRRPDWEVTLATPGDGPLREAARAEGWAVASLPLGGLARRAGARALASWPRARRLAAAHDVVYVNGTVAARVLPALGERCAVLHVHDIVERVPRFWGRARLVLAASGAVAARLDGLEAHVVGCPVEPDPPAVERPWEGGPVVGFVGRLEPRKAPDVLVAAAPAIRAGAPGARVVLVGEDAYAVDASYARAVAGAADVEHVPWVDNAPGLMRHLDVLVLPSRDEPFGTVLAEAMAVGTPVVATRVGGLPEVVEDGVTGALVPPDDPAGLAEAVLRVLDRRDELGRAAALAARRWDADAYARRVGDLVEAACAVPIETDRGRSDGGAATGPCA